MTITLDRYGRILIPKKIREALGIRENMNLQLNQEGNQIIIEPLNENSLYVEENGFIFLNSTVNMPKQDLVMEDRLSREQKLLGL
ncbi:MAG: AbrB/MazE/SpoVT family DNA-binding domain-containing protein [Bacteroidota bacterium]